MKTPPWIAVAIMSDLVALDTSKYLSSLTVPLLVFAADSPFYRKGIEMGRYYTTLVKDKSRFVPVTNGAHMFFYEQAEFFNQNLRDFIKN
jgi:pimeloyl-ACP methyl ester carboxylesterase